MSLMAASPILATAYEPQINEEDIQWHQIAPQIASDAVEFYYQSLDRSYSYDRNTNTLTVYHHGKATITFDKPDKRTRLPYFGSVPKINPLNDIPQVTQDLESASPEQQQLILTILEGKPGKKYEISSQEQKTLKKLRSLEVSVYLLTKCEGPQSSQNSFFAALKALFR